MLNLVQQNKLQYNGRKTKRLYKNAFVCSVTRRLSTQRWAAVRSPAIRSNYGPANILYPHLVRYQTLHCANRE